MVRLTAVLLLILISACDHARERPQLALDAFIQSGRNDLRLNERLELLFSHDLYPGSVDAESVSLQDERGARPRGKWRVDGRRMTFEPALPNHPDLLDGGFKPATSYTLELAGGLQATAIQGYGGRRLKGSYAFTVHTVAADVSDAFLGENPGVAPSGYVTVSDHELPLRSQNGGRVKAGRSAFVLWFDSHLDPRTVVKESFRCHLIVSPELVDVPLRGVTLKQDPAGAWVSIEPENELTEGDFYVVVPEKVKDLGGLTVAGDRNWLEFKCGKGD